MCSSNYQGISKECYHTAFPPYVGVAYNLLIATAFGGLAGVVAASLFSASFNRPDLFTQAWLISSFLAISAIFLLLTQKAATAQRDVICAILEGKPQHCEVVEVIDREMPEFTSRTSYAVFRYGVVVCANLEDRSKRIGIALRLERIGSVKIGDRFLFLHDERRTYPILVGPGILCILQHRTSDDALRLAEASIERLGGADGFNAIGKDVLHSFLM